MKIESEGFLKRGHVVQLDPEHVKNKAFSGCMMIVTEPKAWGAQGYIQGIGTREECGGIYYYRALFREMRFVGFASWLAAFEEEA